MSSAERPHRRRIGRYELHKVIGEGGMGSVYEAVDTKVGRTVALKLVTLPENEASAEKLRLRFMREVRAVSKVGHPNVVEVSDYGFAEDGSPYLVMELLRGRDLGAILRASKGPLPVAYVVDVMLEVCAAVRACHKISIVHRDLKPGNIFVTTVDRAPGWRVKVLDFGVAKDPFGENLTAHGQIIGTMRYLSPEQVNGTFGPESDQYGIGVVLYACLTKRFPYGSLKNVALLKAINKGEFPSPREHRPDLPKQLEDIVLRAMRASPTERFESVYALGQQLWAFASTLGRKSWERFYSTPDPANPGDVEAEATTEICPLTEQDTEEAPMEGSSDATAIAGYDATTVTGVDAVALAASVPTRISASMSRTDLSENDRRANDTDVVPRSAPQAAVRAATRRFSGWAPPAPRILFVCIVVAIVGALALVLGVSHREGHEKIRPPAATRGEAH